MDLVAVSVVAKEVDSVTKEAVSVVDSVVRLHHKVMVLQPPHQVVTELQQLHLVVTELLLPHQVVMELLPPHLAVMVLHHHLTTPQLQADHHLPMVLLPSVLHLPLMVLQQLHLLHTVLHQAAVDLVVDLLSVVLPVPVICHHRLAMVLQ